METAQPNQVLISIPAWPLSPAVTAVPGTRQVMDMVSSVMTTQHPPPDFKPPNSTDDPGILNVWLQTSATNASVGDFPAPNDNDPVLLPQGYAVCVTLSRLAFTQTALQALGAGLTLTSDQTNWDMANEGALPGVTNPPPLRPDKKIRYLPSLDGFEFIFAFDTVKWLEVRSPPPNGAWTTPPMQIREYMFDDNISGIVPSTQTKPKVPMSSSTFLCTVSGSTVSWANPTQRVDNSTVATDTGPPFIENALMSATYFPGLPFKNGVPVPGTGPTGPPDTKLIALSLSINAVSRLSVFASEQNPVTDLRVGFLQKTPNVYADSTGAPAVGISLSPDKLATTVKALEGTDNSGQLQPLLNTMAVRLPQIDLRWPLLCANFLCPPADNLGLLSVDATSTQSVQTPWDMFVFGTVNLTSPRNSTQPAPLTPGNLAELQSALAAGPVPVGSPAPPPAGPLTGLKAPASFPIVGSVPVMRLPSTEVVVPPSTEVIVPPSAIPPLPGYAA
jgi:hypothetical protein